MATITGTQIEQRVRYLAQDEDSDAYRNTSAEILVWLNEATSALCELLPAESLATRSFAMVQGAKQAIPSDAIAMVDVIRNMGYNGGTPGNAIRATSRDMLDQFVPGWQNLPTQAEAVHFIPDAKNPKVFHVYPPMTAGYHIEAVLAVPPAVMTSLSEVIKVNDTYAAALTNYILFRIYSKDAEAEANAALAMSYLNGFRTAAGVPTA